MIKLQVIGHLGKDCVVNNVNGKTVMNFTVAHSEKFKNAQGVQQDKTTWVECAYWSDRTAVAPYLKKGTLVYVEGQPELRNYTTKEGTPGSSLNLRVGSVQLLGGRGDNQGGGEQGNYQSQQSNNYQSQQQNTPATQSQSYNSNNQMNEPLDDLPF